MTMDFKKFYFQCLMLHNFKGGLKEAEWTCGMNSAFGEDTVSERTHRTVLFAFAPETTTSQFGFGQVAHLGSMMSTCTS